MMKKLIFIFILGLFVSLPFVLQAKTVKLKGIAGGKNSINSSMAGITGSSSSSVRSCTACDVNQCQNGGTCVPNSGTNVSSCEGKQYACTCPTGFTAEGFKYSGTKCETKICPNASNADTASLKYNGGTCCLSSYASNGSYSSSCKTALCNECGSGYTAAETGSAWSCIQSGATGVPGNDASSSLYLYNGSYYTQTGKLNGSLKCLTSVTCPDVALVTTGAEFIAAVQTSSIATVIVMNDISMTNNGSSIEMFGVKKIVGGAYYASNPKPYCVTQTIPATTPTITYSGTQNLMLLSRPAAGSLYNLKMSAPSGKYIEFLKADTFANVTFMGGMKVLVYDQGPTVNLQNITSTGGGYFGLIKFGNYGFRLSGSNSFSGMFTVNDYGYVNHSPTTVYSAAGTQVTVGGDCRKTPAEKLYSSPSSEALSAWPFAPWLTACSEGACVSSSCGSGQKCNSSASACENCSYGEQCNCPSGQISNGSGSCVAKAVCTSCQTYNSSTNTCTTNTVANGSYNSSCTLTCNLNYTPSGSVCVAAFNCSSCGNGRKCNAAQNGCINCTAGEWCGCPASGGTYSVPGYANGSGGCMNCCGQYDVCSTKSGLYFGFSCPWVDTYVLGY